MQSDDNVYFEAWFMYAKYRVSSEVAFMDWDAMLHYFKNEFQAGTKVAVEENRLYQAQPKSMLVVLPELDSMQHSE